MENTNFDEFFSSFEAEEGNQTETAENQTGETTETAETTDEVTENTEEGTQEVTEEAESGETSEDNTTNDGDSGAAEAKAEPEKYTIKVNKEERQVTLDEMTALAQKGADYDRIREKLEKGKSDNEALTKELARKTEVYDLIGTIAKDAGVEIPELLRSFRISRLKEKEGLTDKEASERLARLEAEAKLKALEEKASQKTPEQEASERMERDFKEFQQKYPDVQLTEEDSKALSGDVQNGMSLTEAWQKREQAKLEAENKRLNELLKAAEQNKKNQTSSPGSTNSSGSKKKHDPIDDFWSAFS